MARWGACLTRVEGCAETGNSRHRHIAAGIPYTWNFLRLTSSSHIPCLIHYMSVFHQPAVEKTATYQVFRRLPRNLPHNPQSQPSPSISEHNSPAPCRSKSCTMQRIIITLRSILSLPKTWTTISTANCYINHYCVSGHD